MHYFLYLFSIISLQLSAYKQEDWPSDSKSNPPCPYGFTLEEARRLKEDPSFEKELIARLSSLSRTMKKRADELQTSTHGAALAGFSHALIISLSHFLPLAAKKVTDQENMSSILSAIDEAREYFAENYPLQMGSHESSQSKYYPGNFRYTEKRVLKQFFINARAIKRTINDAFKTNLLDINQPALPRVIALILMAQMESDEYYYDYLLPLYFEFSGQKMQLFSCPSEIYLTGMFATLVDKRRNGNVFLKTSPVGEMIAKTIINSAGDLSYETHYRLANVLYPASRDFMTPFALWLKKPLEAPEPVLSSAYPKKINIISYDNHHVIPRKKDNLIDSNAYFNRMLEENTDSFTEILVSSFEQDFDGKILNKLSALLVLLNEVFDLGINHAFINNYQEQTGLLWQQELMDLEEEIQGQIKKQEENSSLVADKNKIQELKRFFILELFCTDNNFYDICNRLVQSIEQYIILDPSIKELRALLKAEQQRGDYLHKALIDTFLFHL